MNIQWSLELTALMKNGGIKWLLVILYHVAPSSWTYCPETLGRVIAGEWREVILKQ
tara:strand:+ start:17344 stop:17511 length:168 start_codon:yes stop_codon:yes gene_type:complete